MKIDIDNSERLNLCAFLPYPVGAVPGQRFRIEQWKTHLEREEGIDVDLVPFADESLMNSLYQPGRFLAKSAGVFKAFLHSARRVSQVKKYDAALVFRNIGLAGPAMLERLIPLLGRPVIYDFDDAIFRLHTSEANRRTGWLKFPGKTSAICRLSSHVVVGNGFLAEYARRFNDRVTVIPTSIETDRYRGIRKKAVEADGRNRVVVGWTGSSTSQTHLEMFAPVLGELIRQCDVELRVVSNRKPELPGVAHTWRPWAPETEIEEISRFDIGIMPMPDDEWSRGKCALKALQCMAAGSPVVCSAVGANCEVIRHGENGMLARTPDEWLTHLKTLIADPHLRTKLGMAGRRVVEEQYSMRRCAGMFAVVARQVAGRNDGAAGGARFNRRASSSDG
jgi:glycosyltransferase involved in cell wall biosynthesis